MFLLELYSLWPWNILEFYNSFFLYLFHVYGCLEDIVSNTEVNSTEVSKEITSAYSSLLGLFLMQKNTDDLLTSKKIQASKILIYYKSLHNRQLCSHFNGIKSAQTKQYQYLGVILI